MAAAVAHFGLFGRSVSEAVWHLGGCGWRLVQDKGSKARLAARAEKVRRPLCPFMHYEGRGRSAQRATASWQAVSRGKHRLLRPWFAMHGPEPQRALGAHNAGMGAGAKRPGCCNVKRISPSPPVIGGRRGEQSTLCFGAPLGLPLRPPILYLANHKVYAFGTASAWPAVAPLIEGTPDNKLIAIQCDDVLRMAASVRKGTVSVLLLLERLGAWMFSLKFDGALFTCKWKEAAWARLLMAAPPRQRQSVERYSIVKSA